MRYQHPTEEIEFEIPDEWWVAAGVSNFVSKTSAFVATFNPDWPTVLVPFSDVQAPKRDVGVIGLHEDRTTSLLRAFIDGTPVPPIEVHVPLGQIACRFTVCAGYHRYYTSIAVGFTMLPVSIKPYFDIYAA